MGGYERELDENYLILAGIKEEREKVRTALTEFKNKKIDEDQFLKILDNYIRFMQKDNLQVSVHSQKRDK